MKKVLLASTALMLSAGFAAAEVSVGGDGRMGIIGGGSDDPLTAIDETDLAFTSRIRISFSASGETDAGLSFGGSVRADNASTVDGGGDVGFAGSVFVDGSFGKITMGDTSGAAEAAVGDLSGVGLTGLGDFNEFLYLSNNTDIAPAGRPAARWDYTTGDLGLHVSANNPGDDIDVYSLAVTYSTGDISLGLGYESADDGVADVDHIIGGVTATFGDATVKAVYGEASDIDFTQYGVSVDYVAGATTLTAFYKTTDDGVAELDDFGVGAAYDLGGGASLKGGIVDVDGEDDVRYDFGISMSF
ncbi:MAG: porin [Pseudomonadota bacterium]